MHACKTDQRERESFHYYFFFFWRSANYSHNIIKYDGTRETQRDSRGMHAPKNIMHIQQKRQQGNVRK